ncbi:Transcription factor RF2b [Acorus calamus]|uniref:Transcription factor RF2b n=1 Tax=Acorus calamus TaxID=4465 RepID=A0AAV9F468_ACOCL|nr:Transcription factor RF2b [Acorus calamus]
MAQLPPKIPNMSPTWPAFRSPPTAAAAVAAMNHHQATSWIDEFLDFSAAKRGAHRRSASDSIAFLEVPSFHHDFDRLDEDQLLSMFSDDVPAPPPPPSAVSATSTPSSSPSADDEKPPLLPPPPEETQSACKQESSPPPETAIDPKRIKRILANRQSAQRSRVRKLQYISELERSVTSLQTEVSALSPRVAFLDHQRLVLNVDNSALKQRIAALAQDKIFKDAHQEALKKEIERLRQVYHQQSLKKAPAAATTTASPTATVLPESETNGCTEKELFG